MTVREPIPALALVEAMHEREERRRGQDYIVSQRERRAAQAKVVGWEPMWQSWMHDVDWELRRPQIRVSPLRASRIDRGAGEWSSRTRPAA